MPTFDVRCVLCGAEQVDVIKRWAEVVLCACGGQTEHIPRASSVNGDEWPGGGPRLIENLGHEPVWCQNKSDLKREMEKRNLRHPDRHVPGDTQLSNWASIMDAQTLANATVLVSRGKLATEDNPGQLDTFEAYLGPVRR